MPEDARSPEGLIGPNAILQLLPQLGGAEAVTATLARAGLSEAPDGTEMIPEGDAARLHRLIREERRGAAPGLLAQAGRDTARYILAHRIPRPAQWLLKRLPAGLAARGLSRAIARHAWTFAGSGRFAVQDPWSFAIFDNPLIRGEASAVPICTWHAAVFETLYRALVHPGARCVEHKCTAQPGGEACRFSLFPGAREPLRDAAPQRLRSM